MINLESDIDIFNYHPPQSSFKGILSIPHSGEELPAEFKPYLSQNLEDISQDIDFRVHELIDITELQAAGICVLKSHIIRTAIDLNRPKIDALLNWKTNSKGRLVVVKQPEKDLAEKLTQKYYSPYYEMLKTQILELQRSMRIPSLIDLHSMPSVAEEYHLKINPHQERVRPHFCLSDIEGLSCEENFIKGAGNELQRFFTNIKYNHPYFGGHITRFLHSTYSPLNNIQIEISRGIYMDEETKSLQAEKVLKLKKSLTRALISHFEFFFDKYKI